MVNVSGTTAPGFEQVREVFIENFAERGDIGAAFAVVLNGELVVDLHGGVADPSSSRPWADDTLVNVWSTTKGVTAACFAMLADRGRIDYSAPVARYWPEFAAAGKQDVTVAMLLSHQAGLSGFRDPAQIEDFYDSEQAAARLAAAEPFWEPGTQAGYHAVTVGFMASELFRRIDGRRLREFVRDELGSLDIHIGLPRSRAAGAATMLAPLTLNSSSLIGDLTPAQIAALANPLIDPLAPNDPAWQAAEIPSANGFATARGLARLYGALASDGQIDGTHLVSPATVRAATTEQFRGVDAVLGAEASWASGFLLNSSGVYGPNQSAFGHSGWGGSFASGDPEAGIGMAYTMNQMGTDLIGDPRAMALIRAVYSSR
ncbi:esterase [Deinococcus seoulensis]|uniref:Esterase n=1 Tax=Deinococcus seoulensis TaxID=1837379 RepID=A0ABQ2RR11_9DEIO|nr:serine hydrolase domain-containing protein [Deinococcus seoulensis]GGR59070.1 esterase [Deinococcus seoulensis]